MPSGQCLCGGVKMTFDDEAASNANKALCHCLDCRKISGSVYSTNLVIKNDSFKWTHGKPKEFTKTADSGKQIISYFCPDCGTTLVRTSGSFPGMVVVKAGVLDEMVDVAKPTTELYTAQKVSWLPKFEGLKQVEGSGIRKKSKL